MAIEQGKVKCPGCGEEFPAGADTRQPDGSVKCPSCQTTFRPPEGAPVRTGSPAATGSRRVLLNLCPICEAGPVRAKGSDSDEEVHVCDTCTSVLRENIFGFRYTGLDPRFEKRKAEFLGQTFTKLDLVGISEQIRKVLETRAGKVETAAPPPGQEPVGKPDEGELWWELDEEELARRKKVTEAKKDVTVEDLLDELKKQQDSRKQKEES
jgi:hypothetical protein